MNLFFKNLIKLAFFAAIVAIIYLAYFFTIGIPKTQARNHYNYALKLIDEGEKKQAMEELNIAKGYWNEKYIEEELQKISNF